MFTGPLKDKHEEEKCSFLMLWVGEKARSIVQTWNLNDENKRAMMALGRSPEYHWKQIISKSVHWFSRRSRLKLFFLFIALAAILFNRAEQFEEFL